MEEKHIVCVGGGHCNCQVLKLFKEHIETQGCPWKLTLVSEHQYSYYSGMLPGTVAGLYRDDELKLQLKPLAAWSQAQFIEQRVSRIAAAENRLYLQDGGTVDYDVLVVNVGSKTKDTTAIKGVWEHALTTRPINYTLKKVIQKEQQLKEQKIIPNVVICGAGEAGTELSFAFKTRWSKFFDKDINVTLLSAHPEPLSIECDQTRVTVKQALKDRGIEVVTNAYVTEVSADRVTLRDGRDIPCNVVIWATGADPHSISTESDLDLLRGFFRVNDYL